ncbi:MAG: flagellar filament capping protein FliD [Steroidobacteraceae bacterium]|nr:flagellar filament capping protein FliD [Steroidobacteraceae bacterium]
MATSGVVGGSQLDVQSLASQLVAAERAPLDRQVARDSNRITTQISAVGVLMGAMSQFRGALASLKTVQAFTMREAVSGDPEIFTVAADSNATPGEYSIEVVQLARAHQISSNAFVGGGEQIVGVGELTISLGEETFSVVIEESNSTLAGIRNAINAAADNPGVRATLIHGAGGSRLVLTSAQTGAANRIEVSQSGGDGGLAALAYSESDGSNYTQLAAAQDSVVNVANAQVTSATNTIENAIDGVTLTLLAESKEEAATLTVSYDETGVARRVSTFVSAYNALVEQITRLRGYDAAAQTAGPMLGDSLLTSIESQLRRTISESVGEAGDVYNTLASIGITTQADGRLSLDTTKLNKALDEDFAAVGKLFGSERGLAARLHEQMDERLKTNGALDMRSKSLVEAQKDLRDRQDRIDARMAVLHKAYIAQFTRLDTLLSQLQVTSSYLSQQIESLGNLNKRSG